MRVVCMSSLNACTKQSTQKKVGYNMYRHNLTLKTVSKDLQPSKCVIIYALASTILKRSIQSNGLQITQGNTCHVERPIDRLRHTHLCWSTSGTTGNTSKENHTNSSLQDGGYAELSNTPLFLSGLLPTCFIFQELGITSLFSSSSANPTSHLFNLVVVSSFRTRIMLPPTPPSLLMVLLYRT